MGAISEIGSLHYTIRKKMQRYTELLQSRFFYAHSSSITTAAAFPVSSFFDWSISFLIHHRPYLLAYIPYLPVLGRIVTDGRLSSFARLSDTFSTTLYSSSIRISGMSSKLNICFLNACKVSNMHFMIIVEGFSFLELSLL